jgi:gliding motility-associated-like protein
MFSKLLSVFLVNLKANKKYCLKLHLYILIAFFSLPHIAVKAQYSNLEFIENKGQWDPKVKFQGDAGAGSFFIRSSGFTVLQHNESDMTAIRESVHNTGKAGVANERMILRSHAYNVDFIGASANVQVIPDKPITTYNNYFIGNDPSKWATGCKIYQAITVKNVYPNIDVRYYTGDGNIKYDIIAKPGSDLNKIALRYAGADKIEVKNKELRVSTSTAMVKELAPYTYQFDGKEKRELSCKYVVKDGVVRFDVKGYDRKATIIIDPSIVFSALSGSRSDNWGFTATYGPDGSMYAGGIVFGTGFPVTAGAFQTTFGGGSTEGAGAHDMGIIKLPPNGGARIYATYIGGSGNEQPHSLIVDPQGNLIIAGRTNSSVSTYPLFPAGNTNGTLGGHDIVVTKLNAAGNGLIGSKRIGGTGDDGVNINATRGGTSSLQRNYGDDGRSEVILDGAGNIYVASCTQSASTSFPIVNGFQAANAGQQDGVVLKLNSNLTTLLFSSYLGGGGDDAAYVLSLAPSGNIFVAGGTASSDFPGNKAGTIGAALQGPIDGFVAEITNNGASLVRSTYIGTDGIDQVYGIQFDNKGFPYITGQTTGTWVNVNAAYFTAGGKQFIAKLQPDLSNYVYSTAFGTGRSNPDISPTAFLVDRCENVYVSGWGGFFGNSNNYSSAGTLGLPVTGDAFQSNTDGKDFYFFVLKKNAVSHLFGSFFGERNTPGGGCDHVDGGTSRFDANGIIYQAICGNCRSLDNVNYPTTDGSRNGTSSGCNLGMLKVNFNLAGVGANIQSAIDGVPADTAGCIPLEVIFTDRIRQATEYIWNFGDNGFGPVSPLDPNYELLNGPVLPAATGYTQSHTFNTVGTYRVRLIAIDPNSCNGRDTAYINIKVGSLEVQPTFDAVKLDPCDSFKFRFDNTSFQPPSKPFTPTSFTWDFGDKSPRITTDGRSVFHNFPGPGTYKVSLAVSDTNYCNSPDADTLDLTIAELVDAGFTAPATGCILEEISFKNNTTPLGGTQFNWVFGDGGTSTETNPTHVYTAPGPYQVILYSTNTNTCNVIDSAKFTITIYGIPTANFSFSPVVPVLNTPTVFTNLSSPDAVIFKWDFGEPGDDDTVRTTSRANISYQYNAPGTFNACLVVFNIAGCSDTLCLPVTALVEPQLDVPNAFTPQQSGINSVVMPKGFGIAKLRFIIYNRWGQKIFETNRRNAGWDGKYKGVLQPMDVYAYTLEVEFFDKTKATKKGDITLIR